VPASPSAKRFPINGWQVVWREAFGFFVAAYRFAADLLKEGVLEEPFPEGSFPPALPYVGDRGGGEAEPALA